MKNRVSLLTMLSIVLSIVACNPSQTSVTPSDEEAISLISNANKDLSPEFLKATEAIGAGIESYTAQLTAEKIKAFENNPELEAQRLGEFVSQFARTNYNLNFNLGSENGARVDAVTADDQLAAEGQAIMNTLNGVIDYRLTRIDNGAESEAELNEINKALTVAYNSANTNKKVSEHDRQIILNSCYANQQLLEPIGGYFDTATNGGVKAPAGRTAGLWKKLRHVVTAVVRVVVNTARDIVKNGLVGCAKGAATSGPSGCITGAVQNITTNLGKSVTTGVKAGACGWKKKWSNAEIIKGTTCP